MPIEVKMNIGMWVVIRTMIRDASHALMGECGGIEVREISMKIVPDVLCVMCYDT